MPVQSGVYELVNQVNGKRYIGSAINLRKRENEHFAHLRREVHHSPYLQRAYNKYGRDAFVFNVLFYTRPEWCVKIEQLMLDELKPEYNCNPMAGSSLGSKQTPETKRKIGKASKGNQFRKGIPHTNEVRAQISKSLKIAFSHPVERRRRAEGTRRRWESMSEEDKLRHGKVASRTVQAVWDSMVPEERIRRLGLLANASIQSQPRANHVRWHVNRNRTSAACRFCREDR